MSLLERYLTLGLRLGKHVDGLVDAYYGPPGLAEAVDGEALRPAADLAADADVLAPISRYKPSAKSASNIRAIHLMKRCFSNPL